MVELTYMVRGIWPFPLDMLRYDGSDAATSEDRALIDRLSGDHAPDRAAFQPVDISLTGPRRPNTARWESFGWAVPGDLEQQMVKRWQEEEHRNAALLKSALAKLTPDEAQAVRQAISHATGGSRG